VHTILWIVTALVTIAFLAAGGMELTQPEPRLVSSGQGWAEDVPDRSVKAIGAAVTQARRRECPDIAVNLLLAALAVFVAVERLGPHAL
jgi:hypothetical protein